MASIDRRLTPTVPNLTPSSPPQQVLPQVSSPPSNPAPVRDREAYWAARPQPQNGAGSSQAEDGAGTMAANGTQRVERAANATSNLADAAQGISRIRAGVNAGAQVGEAVQRVSNSGAVTGRTGEIVGAASRRLGVAAAGVGIYNAATDPNANNVIGAVGSTATAASGVLQARAAVAGERAATRAVQNLAARSGNRAAAATVRAAAPEIAQAAAQAAASGGGRAAINATEAAARAVSRTGVSTTARVAMRAAPTAAHAAAGAAARAGSRFVPGLNVAVAAADSTQAGLDIYRAVNGNGSVGRAVLSSVTAAGSIVAATNVPIVSQIGAGVSAATGLVRDLFWSN